MANPLEKILSMPLAAKLLVAACTASLGFALIMQYVFKLEPCVLCLWQRVPFAVGIVLSLLVWGWRPYGRQTKPLLIASSFVFLVGMGLAVFHTGVEHHWWLGTAGCAVQPLSGGSAADLRETLLHTVAPRCDEVQWTMVGMSMANLNIALSFFLAIFAMSAALCADKGTRRPEQGVKK